MTSNADHPMAQPRVAAGALFLDDEGRILLVRPTYKPLWDIPGGYVEPGESPMAACVREVREELGVSIRVGRLLIVDWAPNDDEGDKMLFVFDGGILTSSQIAQLEPDGAEITEHRRIPLTDLDDYVLARLARRMRTAVVARRQGRTIYAEHGDER